MLFWWSSLTAGSQIGGLSKVVPNCWFARFARFGKFGRFGKFCRLGKFGMFSIRRGRGAP